MKQTNIVYSAFKNPELLQRALDHLHMQAVTDEDITLFVPRDQNVPNNFQTLSGSNVSRGALIGLGGGTMLGGFIGILVGFGVLDLPLLSQAINVAPWLAVVLCGLAGGIAGSASGALVGIGVPFRAPARYASYVDEGGYVLAFRVRNAARRAHLAELIERLGGGDVFVVDGDSAQNEMLSHGARKIASRPHLNRV